MTDHHRKLERLYLGAPCNAHVEPTIAIGEGTAEVAFEARAEFHHAARAVHGAYYFKALDDAAFFAASSVVDDVFVLTASFHLDFLRPVAAGPLTARGRVVRAGRSLVFAESVLVDAEDRELARGRGVFARSEIALDAGVGYA